MWLCQQIINSGAGVLSEEYKMIFFPGDDLLAAARPRGLPIGNLTSQFWANVFLNGFDHFIRRELHCCAYARYVDDFLLFADDKGLLWEWKAAVERRLARLRLVIHSGAHPRPVTEGFPFLGFVISPRRRRLKRRKGIHFQRKLRKMLAEFWAGRLPPERLTACVQGWTNHVRFGNTIGLRKAVLGQAAEFPKKKFNAGEGPFPRAPILEFRAAECQRAQSSEWKKGGRPPENR